MRDYASAVIDRVYGEYGVRYIKNDYSIDIGIGTEIRSDSFGDGLLEHCRAFILWVDEIKKKYPDLIWENCSSGGMRMDYAMLSISDLQSTSDQTEYAITSHIAAAAATAVLPEQAAVWSYPIDSWVGGFAATSEWANANVSDEQIIMNMINSFLGRMHLASHLELLNEEKFALVKEGVKYYNSIRAAKKKALPYLPLGFTNFGNTLVASGLLTDERLYLAVWNLGGDKKVSIPLEGVAPKVAKVAYPACNTLEYKLVGNSIEIEFTEDYQARMLEIEL